MLLPLFNETLVFVQPLPKLVDVLPQTFIGRRRSRFLSRRWLSPHRGSLLELDQYPLILILHSLDFVLEHFELLLQSHQPLSLVVGVAGFHVGGGLGDSALNAELLLLPLLEVGFEKVLEVHGAWVVRGHITPIYKLIKLCYDGESQGAGGMVETLARVLKE